MKLLMKFVLTFSIVFVIGGCAEPGAAQSGRGGERSGAILQADGSYVSKMQSYYGTGVGDHIIDQLEYDAKRFCDKKNLKYRLLKHRSSEDQAEKDLLRQNGGYYTEGSWGEITFKCE